MSTLTFEVAIGSIPGVQLKDGQPFRGIFKAGKMHVTVEDHGTENLNVPSHGAAAEQDHAKGPADAFVDRWSGAFTLPHQDELDADPRLAYLIHKHFK